MQDNNGNPESLHDKGKGKGMMTTPVFDQSTTPKTALVKESDMPGAQTTSEGTNKLRQNLIKD